MEKQYTPSPWETGEKDKLSAFIEEFRKLGTMNPFDNRTTLLSDMDVGVEVWEFADAVNFNIATFGERSMGLGTIALRRIIDLANKHQVPLRITVEPFGTRQGLTKYELLQWYKRHGFVVDTRYATGDVLIKDPDPVLSSSDEESIIPDIEHSFTYNGVLYDQRRGVGNVPIQGQVNYEGYTVFMKISDFLSLNPLRMEPISEEMRARISGGEPVASPWMNAEIEEDGSVRITGHEGRGRAMVLQGMHGDIEIPVNIFIRRTPAAYIPEGTVLREIKSDPRRATYSEYKPRKVVWKKQLITQEV